MPRTSATQPPQLPSWAAHTSADDDGLADGVGVGVNVGDGVPVGVGERVGVGAGHTAVEPKNHVRVVHWRLKGPDVWLPDTHSEASEHQPQPAAATHDVHVDPVAHTSGDALTDPDGLGLGELVRLAVGVSVEVGVGNAGAHPAPPANAQSAVVHWRALGPRASVPDAHWLQAVQGVYGLDDNAAAFADLVFRRRLQTLRSVDAAIADVVTTLNALGVLNNTYIVFSADSERRVGGRRAMAAARVLCLRPPCAALPPPLPSSSPSQTATTRAPLG